MSLWRLQAGDDFSLSPFMGRGRTAQPPGEGRTHKQNPKAVPPYGGPSLDFAPFVPSVCAADVSRDERGFIPPFGRGFKGSGLKAGLLLWRKEVTKKHPLRRAESPLRLGLAKLNA